MDQESGKAYAYLVWCTEHPESEWRRVPRAHLSDAARNVRLVMDLLGNLDRHGWAAEYPETVALIHAYSPDELTEIGDAIASVGGTRALWYLKLLVLHLRGRRDDTPMQPAAALAKLEQRPGLQRVLWRSMEICDELVIPLSRYLEQHQLDRGLTFQDIGHLSSRAPSSPQPPHHRSPSDPKFVILRWDHEVSLDLIDAWLGQIGGAVHFGVKASRPVSSVRQAGAHEPRHRWYFGLPDKEAIGILRAGHGHPQLSLGALCAHPDEYIASLLSAFEWALVPMMTIEREGRFAFVSDNPQLQHRFLRFVASSRFRPFLIGFHDDPHLLGSSAEGAQFGEADQFGQVALLAAEADGELPLVGAHFCMHNGFRWFRLTEQCECLAIRGPGDPLGARVGAVYRPPNREVFLELWSRIGRDDNIAFLSVPGGSDPQRVADHLVCNQPSEIEIASHRFGWAYGHVWGGGADEHFAVFHAKDAAITNRVYDYAASRVSEGWWLSGRWSTPTKVTSP